MHNNGHVTTQPQERHMENFDGRLHSLHTAGQNSDDELNLGNLLSQRAGTCRCRITGAHITEELYQELAARPPPAAAQPLPNVTATTISPAAAVLKIHSHASHDCLRFRSVLLQLVPFGQWPRSVAWPPQVERTAGDTTVKRKSMIRPP